MSGVFVSSTDPAMLDTLLAEVRKRVPSFKSNLSKYHEFPRGSHHGLELTGLKYYDSEVAWWIME